ncbi:MAG TPA: DUF6495 family protein [Cryomorphaceae bacterium]|nr:DUF6495 family protein [Cryomorphaceae bacterium]
MKYRKLNIRELEDLREDFVHFLSANSITADDWVKIKKVDPDAAERMIEVFSDIVWEKVLSNIRYLRFVNPQALRVIHFGEEKAELIQLEIKDESFNLSDQENIRSMAEGSLDLNRFDPEMTTGSKKYSIDRDREVFIHLEQGWQPAKEVFWAALSSMIVKDS